MRILILAPEPFYQPRGTPIAVKLLVEVLAGNGYRCEMLTYHEGEDVAIPNVRIHRIPSLFGLKNIRPGPSWKKILCDGIMLICCLKMVCTTKFDLIHAVEESAFIAMFMKAFLRIPFVYDMDSSLTQQIIDKYNALSLLRNIFKFFEKITVRASVGVLAVCKSLEADATAYSPNTLVYRLEDISLLQSMSKPGDLLEETLKIKGPISMYVGNLERYQGVDLLLESFKLASEEVPKSHLVIIGGSDKDIQRYQHRSKELGIEKKVHFIGPRPIDQLGFYLDQADILISPRLQGQNTPMKIYSYLDSGRPVLATRLFTHTQVLDDQIAFIVEPEPREMAKGIVTLLKDRRLGNDISRLAKERVKQEFSYEAFQKKLLEFYEIIEKRMIFRGS